MVLVDTTNCDVKRKCSIRTKSVIFFLFTWHSPVLHYYNNGIDNIKWSLCCIYNSKYEMYFRLPFNHRCGRFILFEENMCQVTCWFDSTKLLSSFALFIALHTTCIIVLWTIELCLSQQSVKFFSVILDKAFERCRCISYLN